ncbi:hypothetical protein Btru_057971 [Bulinus truncatus]|nr:hypothetical protein Btru_057971 [Bulinus truncatus]
MYYLVYIIRVTTSDPTSSSPQLITMSGDYKTIVSNITQYSHIGFTLALAKEVGVIDALVISTTPITVSDIAKDKRLKQRYVQEMLGCLVSAGLVKVQERDSESGYYIDDAGKEVWRTGVFQSSVSFINALMEAYRSVKMCLPVDGPYGASYGEDLMRALDEGKQGSVDGVAKLMVDSTPGLRQRLEEGIRVTEIGSGWGSVIGCLATLFPKSVFTASEYWDELVNSLKAKWHHLPNMSFEKIDACNPPSNRGGTADWLYVVDVIHDLPHPLKALQGIREMLDKVRGIFTALEIVGTGNHAEDAGNLRAAQMYSMSTFLCVPESFQSEDSEAHGACWPKASTVQEYMSAGFHVDVVDLEGSDGREILLVCTPLKCH